MDSADVAIIGGGAAGLAAAVFAARRWGGKSIVLLGGGSQLGAKILASGGGRCNLTNAQVSSADFHGGDSRVITRVLRSFNVGRTMAFFREIGVELIEEEGGKIFPQGQSARLVRDALLRQAERTGVRILTGHRVLEMSYQEGGFVLSTTGGTMTAEAAVVATGGLSVPKTGSDGAGYRLAQGFGHSLVPTTPALVPLVLDGSFHRPLSGVAHEVVLTIQAEGQKPARFRGDMLWTHFGVSGPVVLDASRDWHRARLEGRPVRVSACLLPDEDFPTTERRILDLAAAHPKRQVGSAGAFLRPDRSLPDRVYQALLRHLGADGSLPLAHLGREERRKLVRALTEWNLPIRDSRGYEHAEVTSGGVPLEECHPATLESRLRPRLFFAGEVLDVDGRIGGFNFQWAWSSAFVVASALFS